MALPGPIFALPADASHMDVGSRDNCFRVEFGPSETVFDPEDDGAHSPLHFYEGMNLEYMCHIEQKEVNLLWLAAISATMVQSAASAGFPDQPAYVLGDRLAYLGIHRV